MRLLLLRFRYPITIHQSLLLIAQFNTGSRDVMRCELYFTLVVIQTQIDR